MPHQNVLLVITGSIAAYKAVDLLREMQQKGHNVSIIVTQAGQYFATIPLLASFSRGDVYDDQDQKYLQKEPMRHIRLARQHQVTVIAPASANFIAKMAAGIAEGLALETLLATQGRVVVAPAMNPQMWLHPATQANIKTLQERGVEIIAPVEGVVACGEDGVGKYAGNEAVLNALENTKTALTGKTAIVTLGSTRTVIDSVRYISNYSTGQQGLAVAHALRAQGCEVHLVCGHVSVDIPEYFTKTYVSSNQEMLDACLANLPADIFIGCAAVCDYKLAVTYPNKLKKQSGAALKIELVEDIDVLANIAASTPRPACMVGFALESEEHVNNAQKKLQRKNLDAIVVNSVGDLGVQQKEFAIVTKGNLLTLGGLSKSQLADRLSQEIINHFNCK